MSDRKYYTERKGTDKRLSLQQLKRLFLTFYAELRKEGNYGSYLSNANSQWTPNAETYILTHLRLDNVWPIEKQVDNYDEDVLFTIMEFLYDFVEMPMSFEDWDDERKTKHAKQEARDMSRARINEMLKGYDRGYQLTEGGEIVEIVPEEFSHLVTLIPETDDQENVDERVQYAISRFFTRGSKAEDRKEALRILGDVMEYLKRSGIRLDTKDEKSLFQILNQFAIRHHNKTQLDDYDKDSFYEYRFYVLLASVRFLMKRISDETSQ